MSELIMKGTHRALCRSVQLGWTDKQQTEIAIGWEIISGDDIGRFMTSFHYPDSTEKSFQFTVEALRFAGWTGDDFGELSAIATAGQLATEVDLVVDHEEYDGKIRAKVKFVNRPGGGGLLQVKKPMTEVEAKAFATRMRSRVRAFTGRSRDATSSNGSSRQTQMPTHPNAPGAGDDECPF